MYAYVYPYVVHTMSYLKLKTSKNRVKNHYFTCVIFGTSTGISICSFNNIFRQTSIIFKDSTGQLLGNTFVLHARSKEANRQFPLVYVKSRDPNESTLSCHVIAQARKKRDNGGCKS